ncbi:MULTISPECIES: hypothetical protein [unclassified Psychrobacter]|uniref:hypothetical protein n=1 Tax=unclassified Psychrobacter TaxID=196806 RepID=UPI000B06B2B2|nr:MULTISPECIES: hypothetical protein [unclassified Psychrobacter]
MSTLKKHNTAFTESLMASFGFVILISIIMDIGVQLNVWRIVAVSWYQLRSL